MFNIPQVQAPNVLGNFEASERNVLTNQLAQAQEERARNALALNERSQAFSEQDANRRFELTERQYEDRLAAAERARREAAAARAAASRRGILDRQRESAIAVAETMLSLPEGPERQRAYTRFLERLNAAGEDVRALGLNMMAPTTDALRVTLAELSGEAVDAPEGPEFDLREVNGSLVYVPKAPGGGAAIPVANVPEATPEAGWSPMSPEEIDAAGLDPEKQWYGKPGEVPRAAAGGGGLGMRVSPDGTVEFGTDVKFTEGQAKDNVFATRAAGALPIIDEYEGALTVLGDRILDNDPTGLVRGALQKEDFQVGMAAGREFLMAILRKDTGAAITPSEEQLYGSLYLPQPGDGPRVIAFKRQARRRALEAIRAGMSPAQILVTERALQASSVNAEGRLPTSGGRNNTERGAAPAGGGPRILSVEPIR